MTIEAGGATEARGAAGADAAVAAARAAKGPGYQDPSVVGCQFSVYPLRQADIDTPVQAVIHEARAAGVSVRVGNLSTLLWGSEDEVFAALRAAFRAAQRHGPAVLTATLAAGMPTDELVGAIQSDVDGAPAGQGAPAAGDDMVGGRPAGAAACAAGTGGVEKEARS
jgi:uncharacterized protein YqgV (UPF0045/DUF77 family)